MVILRLIISALPLAMQNYFILLSIAFQIPSLSVVKNRTELSTISMQAPDCNFTIFLRIALRTEKIVEV